MAKKSEVPVKVKQVWWQRAATKGAVNNQPSETIQNESFTIPELLARHQMGNMPDIHRQVWHDNIDNLDDIDISQGDKDLIDRVDVEKYLDKLHKKLVEAEANKKAIDEKIAELKARSDDKASSAKDNEGTEANEDNKAGKVA